MYKKLTSEISNINNYGIWEHILLYETLSLDNETVGHFFLLYCIPDNYETHVQRVHSVNFAVYFLLRMIFLEF